MNPPDYWPNEHFDLVNNDNIPEDNEGHGTHVAGIAAAVGDNGVGVIGVAYKAKIIPVKILELDQLYSVARATAGIVLATQAGANVTNMSFMAAVQSKAMGDALKDAHDKGVLLVACAGNKNLTKPWFPAGFPEVMAVGSTDLDDQRSSWSNKGSWVDIAAPGNGVLSTYNSSRSGYWVMEGTSMSSPHVAGSGALLIAARPDLSVDQVRAVLEGSGAPLDTSDWQNSTIRRLDVGAACTYMLGTPPSIDITNPLDGSIVSGTVSITVNTSDPDGEVKKVIFYAGDYPLLIDDSPPFTVDWDTTHLPNTYYTLRAIAYDNQAQRTTATANVTVNNTQLTPDYFNDFEGSNEGWWTRDESGSTSWHLITDDYNSPSHCWKMGDIGGGGYGQDEYDFLFSPVFDLSGVEHARVKFYHHFAFADQFDHGFLTINTGDGEYHILATYYNEQYLWGQENVLLDDYLSKSIQIVFIMESDHSNSSWGWFVDDFSLVKSTSPPTVDLTSPADGATVSGTTGVTATAADDVLVSKVDLLINDQFIASAPTAPYSFSYNTNNLHGGDNTFKVTAYDEFPLTASDSAAVIVRNHVINSFWPLSATAGSALNISGNRFIGLGTDAYNPATDKVMFTGATGPIQAEVTSWGKVSIDCKVPDDATIGPVSVIIGNSASVSSASSFSIKPAITSISPAAEIVGNCITIAGTGFLPTQETGYVSFNGLQAPDVVSWGNREIIVSVPDGATPGPVIVTTQVSTSNGMNFTPLPHINSLSSNRAYIGKAISINGTSFGGTQDTSAIYFYDNVLVPSGNILDWSPSQLTFIVPSGVSTGDVYVIVGGNESNKLLVTLTLPPPGLGSLAQK
jgi:hypothetical protein